MSSTGEQNSSALPPEEEQRAQVYALLARLLAQPPGADLLAALASMQGDAGPFGQAVTRLAESARGADARAVEEEFLVLFIGVGGGVLSPYASYYLTGFLHEKPLAELRDDMARLGIARADDVKEPEDHMAALAEMMAGLITGAFGEPADLGEQRRFFDRHVASWAGRFFADLEATPSVSFYKAVGTLGRRFLEVEGQAFDMAA
ncbi:TorD/DmsD family molecular chaperone [Azospirillum canadense]|uniref:TorD/DmsD family molecular chaperone n=1 Tax=Azospirillum canadense TaxID=403962 RepID=UPI00222601F8|nr:molecular chaperone TorD family protein [Azospirillum canadense]MCW2236085.1 TorA maturation chaperone TorD [Azospirillum canadense]